MSELRALAPSLLLLAAAALFMVHAMVKWTEAMLERGRSPQGPVAPGVPATVRWGTLYAAAWGAVVAALFRFFSEVGEEPATWLPLLLLGALGWLALNWGVVALARTTRQPDAADLAEGWPQDADEDDEEEPEAPPPAPPAG
jgi:hypothetical protein